MTANVYKETRPDYYPKNPTLTACNNQIKCLASKAPRKYLYVDEKEGIKLVGLLAKIWQTIKGLFGFENRTDALLINSETLKLLHYCDTKGYLSDTEVQKSLKKVNTTITSKKVKSLGKTVGKVIKGISSKERTLSSSGLREKLVAYHDKYRDDLPPSFWMRQMKEPVIAINENTVFGSTYLQLANRAQYQRDSLTTFGSIVQSIKELFEDAAQDGALISEDEALKHYQFALSTSNDDETFQSSLRNQFKNFVTNSWEGGSGGENWSTASETQKKTVYSITKSISSYAIKHKKENEAEDYAKFGLTYFPDALSLKTIKTEALVKQAKYDDAFKDVSSLEQRAEALELKVKCDDSDEKLKKKAAAKQKELYEIYVTLGEIYSHHEEKGWFSVSRDYAKASTYYLKAWQMDQSDPEVEAKLFNTLMVDAEKETRSLKGLWGKFTNWLGFTSDKKGKDLVEQASQYISEIKLDDLQRLITLLEQQKEYAKAIHFYEFGTKKWADADTELVLLPQTYLAMSRSLAEENKDVEAYETIAKAMKMDPNNKEIAMELFFFGRTLVIKYRDASDFKAAYYYCNQMLTYQLKPHQESQIREHLKKICETFAKESVENCLIPYGFRNHHSIKDWKAHKEKVAEHLKTALKWYDEAISHDPTNGQLHFDKAELLNFFEMKDADDFEEYKLAVQHAPKNYFYLVRLSEVYNERNDEEAYQKYQDLAVNTRQNIAFDYLHWFDDRFLKDKTYNIDPHTF